MVRNARPSAANLNQAAKRQMITRRDAIRVLSSGSAAAWFAATQMGLNFSLAPGTFAAAFEDEPTPPLAPEAPTSPERLTLIKAFRERSEGLQNKFEARVLKGELEMPYRLFRPETTGKLPLVVYLHGGGGLGNDNLKQLQFGNIFGTRLWLLPENQKRFPCYVVAPQSDSGWVRYNGWDPTEAGLPRVLPGLGEEARLALEIIDNLCHEFAIDERRIYITGNSMGGSGVWHITAERPKLFAAAVACCGGDTAEDAVASLDTPLWNFHGDADQSVPVALSRGRITALRRVGGHPLYTEYSGVDHDGATDLAYTEPALPEWLFSHHRG
jgi:predicted peptidase